MNSTRHKLLRTVALGAIAGAVSLSVAALPVFAATATNITGPNGATTITLTPGQSATVTVAVTGLTSANVNAARIALVVPAGFTVTGSQCAGIFANPAATCTIIPQNTANGVQLNAGILGGVVTGTSGNVLTFTLTNGNTAATGTVTLTLDTANTVYVRNDQTSEGPGTAGNLTINTAAAATATAVAATATATAVAGVATATPTPVIPEWSPMWLFGSGLLALGGLAHLSNRRRRN